MLEKIDVTIATKNNEPTIKKCIGSIKKYIPYNEIIIVDGYSTDKTVDIAKKLGAKIYFDGGLLGEIRYKQASLCKTKWIALIDSDVFINKKWWSETSKYKDDENVGAMYGWLDESFKDQIPSYEKYLKYYRETFNSRQKILSSRSKYKQWGIFTFSNALIKREIILKSKKTLINKHASEDIIVAKNAVKWNYLIVPVTKVLGVHYHINSVSHCKMRYNRMGQSMVINWGKLAGLQNVLFYFGLFLSNFTRYTIYSRNFDIDLFRFLFILYKEFVKGVYSKIKKS